jgi:hypothetical protein
VCRIAQIRTQLCHVGRGRFKRRKAPLTFFFFLTLHRTSKNLLVYRIHDKSRSRRFLRTEEFPTYFLSEMFCRQLICIIIGEIVLRRTHACNNNNIMRETQTKLQTYSRDPKCP